MGGERRCLYDRRFFLRAERRETRSPPRQDGSHQPHFVRRAIDRRVAVFGLPAAGEPVTSGAFHEPQFPNPNDESRSPKEYRMTKPLVALLSVVRHSSFGFLSSLVIRKKIV